MGIPRNSVLSMFAVLAAAASVAATSTATAEPTVARPHGANPYLSWGSEPTLADVKAWQRYAAQKSATQATPLAVSNPVEVREAEPPGVVGQNDTRANAEAVPDFGSGFGKNPNAVLRGQLADDIDVYRVELRAGDIVGIKLEGAAHRITIFDPNGVEVMGSAQDLADFRPSTSPLPRGGNATADHVASIAGTHYIAVSNGTGDYASGIQVHRPPLSLEGRPQSVYLDFNGETIDAAIFGDPPGPRTLSPFKTFLWQWGLTEADESAVASRILEVVRKNFEDVARRGNTRNRLIVYSSLDTSDQWGKENMSRVIVGGTIAELGFNTIGVAQSTDPGNFVHEETAVMLLDRIGAAPGRPDSLNTYVTSQSDRVKFVGQAIANVISHEIGHYVGSWHTDPNNGMPSLMDAGGSSYQVMFGVGPDRVGGTADDTNVVFSSDVYRPSEGFTGTEDALNRTAFGLSGFTGEH